VEPWERPILAHAEETAGQFSRPGERALLWQLHDRFKHEDMQRIREGMACACCLQTFPAPPSLANLQAWKPIMDRWQPLKRRQDILLDLARQRCPTCNSDVRPEIVELMDVGHDYNNERQDD
jgi:hypothetical protein